MSWGGDERLCELRLGVKLMVNEAVDSDNRSAGDLSELKIKFKKIKFKKQHPRSRFDFCLFHNDIQR